MQMEELPALKMRPLAGRARGFGDCPSSSKKDEETQAFTPAAVQHLVEALKGSLAEQLDELRTTLPAEIAAAVWSHSSQHYTRSPTNFGRKQPALHMNDPDDSLLGNQRTISFDNTLGIAQRCDSNPSQPPETPVRKICSDQSRLAPKVSTETEDSRRYNWISESNNLLCSPRASMQRQKDIDDSAEPKLIVSKVETIGGLKSHIAEQLLRKHALLPQHSMATLSLSKVVDESVSSKSICSFHGQSPFASHKTSPCKIGALSILPSAPDGFSSSGSRQEESSRPVTPEASRGDELQDSQDQTENGMTSRSDGLDHTLGAASSIKTLVSTLDPRSGTNLNQVEELRKQRVSQLTSQMHSGTSSVSSDDSGSLSGLQTSKRAMQYNATLLLPGRWLLLVFGVLPLRHFLTVPLRQSRWSSLAGCYQPLVFIIVALACFKVSACSLKLGGSHGLPDIEDGMKLGLLSDIALAIASLVGLLLLGAPFGSHTLCECFPLLFLSGDEASHMKLTKRMLRELVGLMSIWFAALLWRLGHRLLFSDDEQDCWSALHFCSFVVISGVLISLALAMLSVCHSLAIMIDTFCVKVSEISISSGDLTVAVREWNVLQAVLRKASNTIEYCFFALQTGVFAAVLLAFFDVTQGSVIQIVPGALLFLGLTRIFYCAAAITDKCADVPSLINSLYFGEDLDVQRQYVVQYMMQSAAGFYVFGVPWNSAVTLKLAYFCGVVTLGLMHRVLSGGW